VKSKGWRKKAGDTCWLCGVTHPHSGTESWENETASIEVPTSSVGFAILGYKGPNERELCENCYLKGDLEFKLNPRDLYDAHYQFGLHYSEFGRDLQKAREAFAKCRMAKETASSLAALANVESALGRKKVAEELYRKALAIEPEHFIARENLRNMLCKNAEGGTQPSDEGGLAQ
jgi:tetratricopeptide (TPR) repeat protein